MIWLWVACSSPNMEKSTQEDWMLDTGFYASEDTASTGMAEDADASVLDPVWMKVSVDIELLEGLYPTLEMKRDLFAEDMTWICQQDLQVDVEINPMPLLLEAELALTVSNIMVVEDSCGVTRIEDSMELMIGELLPNVAVATEVTHWLDGDEYLETESVWGAYVQTSPDQDICAFGIAMQPTESHWLVRTVYSLPW